MSTKCLLPKCLLAKCLLAKCLLAKCLLTKNTQFGAFWSKTIWSRKGWINKAMTPLFGQYLVTLKGCHYMIMSTKCLLAKYLLTKRHSLVTSGQKSFGQQSLKPTKLWPHYSVNSWSHYKSVVILQCQPEFGAFWSKTIWPTKCGT